MQVTTGGRETEQVIIDAGGVRLHAELTVPESAEAVIVFAHGSGSGRHSPRNQFVARALREGRLGTLLFDLLTEQEEIAERTTRHLRFDIELLAGRILGATDWLLRQPVQRGRAVGYFGASTGAAAAIVAAAERPNQVGAIVSRGGRPDLAGEALARIRQPTLLIVGGNDVQVMELNRLAHDEMVCVRELRSVPGASHLFAEPGTLEAAAAMARDWFRQHLTSAPIARPSGIGPS
jgi:putative phosphoribosyl transferase